MSSIEALRQALITMPLLQEAQEWGEEEVEEYLDARESDSFDRQWMQTYDALQALENERDLNATTIDEIRETAFLKAYDLTGDGELAGYVSDDFELIAKGLHFEYTSDFLTAMYNSYKAGRLPR